MKNNFKLGVEETRKNIEVVKAEEVAKEIKQYGGLDVYELMKSGQMYAIVVDGVVIGGANSEEEAQKAIEFLTHFTNGKPLNKESLYMAGMKSMQAMERAYNLVDAEKDGIKIKETYIINGEEYVADETGELYTIDGKHITNISDLLEAKLNKELLEEILTSRIQKVLDKERMNCDCYDCDEYECDDTDDDYYHDEDGNGDDDEDDCVEDILKDLLHKISH